MPPRRKSSTGAASIGSGTGRGRGRPPNTPSQNTPASNSSVPATQPTTPRQQSRPPYTPARNTGLAQEARTPYTGRATRHQVAEHPDEYQLEETIENPEKIGRPPSRKSSVASDTSQSIQLRLRPTASQYTQLFRVQEEDNEDLEEEEEDETFAPAEHFEYQDAHASNPDRPVPSIEIEGSTSPPRVEGGRTLRSSHTPTLTTHNDRSNGWQLFAGARAQSQPRAYTPAFQVAPTETDERQTFFRRGSSLARSSIDLSFVRFPDRHASAVRDAALLTVPPNRASEPASDGTRTLRSGSSNRELRARSSTPSRGLFEATWGQYRGDRGGDGEPPPDDEPAMVDQVPNATDPSLLDIFLDEVHRGLLYRNKRRVQRCLFLAIALLCSVLCSAVPICVHNHVLWLLANQTYRAPWETISLLGVYTLLISGLFDCVEALAATVWQIGRRTSQLQPLFNDWQRFWTNREIFLRQYVLPIGIDIVDNVLEPCMMLILTLALRWDRTWVTSRVTAGILAFNISLCLHVAKWFAQAIEIKYRLGERWWPQKPVVCGMMVVLALLAIAINSQTLLFSPHDDYRMAKAYWHSDHGHWNGYAATVSVAGWLKQPTRAVATQAYRITSILMASGVLPSVSGRP